MNLRLQFTNGGDPDPADLLNTWETCLNNGAECFMPRYLQQIVAVNRAIGAGDGNIEVTYDRIVALGLQFRQRYAP